VTSLFSDEMRRNPFPIYDQLRAVSPVLHVPPFDAWLVFDYEGVRRVTTDHETFSSAVKGPPNWFIFADPPRHTRLRALIAKAFTPSSVTGLEPFIRDLARQLLDESVGRGVMDLATDFAGPLPMIVIARLIGIPDGEMPRYRRWSDEILKLSYGLFGGDDEARSVADFRTATAEMREYLPTLLDRRRAEPRDDLLTRLVQAEVNGERLTDEDILGFFQLLLVGGQETTTNLIGNAVICFMEHPEQLARIRGRPGLLPSAIEEVLRYRSPLQWLMRTPRHDVELHGKAIPAGELVLPVLGSANRDPKQFPAADRFDVTREPNPHIAFGHGLHSCLGAPLARLEARVALEEFLARVKSFEPVAEQPWVPRQALNVHGPARLPIHVEFNA
jgi:cytochrome P450